MPNLPAHVANAFLYRARQEGVADIDPLKIQKLVYCLHGWHLATRDAPAVGELFQAWPYGPVLSSLYHEFKQFGSATIANYAEEIDPNSGVSRSLMVSPNDKAFYDVFDAVWTRYKNLNGIQLSALTHADGTPWSTARQRGLPYLSNDEIRAHFQELANRAS
jgi:uncharacterized phage-associated protein